MSDYLFEEIVGDLICGVDEVGRGPLAGPVVAAAVILDPRHPIEGLRDSKKLSPKKREILSQEIRQHALAWYIAEGSVEEIDRINILQSTLLTMKRAVEGLTIKPDMVLVDGNRLPQIAYRCEAIVGGDDKIPAISAASILAKTYRDNLMEILGHMYPHYGFERHAGYGTAEHLKALKKWGPCPCHRLTFAPVAEVDKRLSRKADREKRRGINL
ncbi:MAG: ribonuclease HII [Burkholderiaceae bacterium]|nr:ribonuclease HII [Burkholderiaceae bacterium]